MVVVPGYHGQWRGQPQGVMWYAWDWYWSYLNRGGCIFLFRSLNTIYLCFAPGTWKWWDLPGSDYWGDGWWQHSSWKQQTPAECYNDGSPTGDQREWCTCQIHTGLGAGLLLFRRFIPWSSSQVHKKKINISSFLRVFIWLTKASLTQHCISPSTVVWPKMESHMLGPSTSLQASLSTSSLALPGLVLISLPWMALLTLPVVSLKPPS